MWKFLRPWRRKIGLLTLVVACMFTIFWIRSFIVTDVIMIALPTFPPYPFVVSSSGRVGVWAMDGWDFEWNPILRYSDCFPITWAAASYIGFHFKVPTIPHWWIFIPLILISAELLLSEPRPPSVKVST